jgi:hypothetical protein
MQHWYRYSFCISTPSIAMYCTSAYSDRSMAYGFFHLLIPSCTIFTSMISTFKKSLTIIIDRMECSEQKTLSCQFRFFYTFMSSSSPQTGQKIVKIQSDPCIIIFYQWSFKGFVSRDEYFFEGL